MKKEKEKYWCLYYKGSSIFDKHVCEKDVGEREKTETFFQSYFFFKTCNFMSSVSDSTH